MPWHDHGILLAAEEDPWVKPGVMSGRAILRGSSAGVANIIGSQVTYSGAALALAVVVTGLTVITSLPWALR